MGFDFENFGIGLVAGWVTAYGVYRARHRIRSAVESVTQGATSAQNYANQTADRRYINDLARNVETNHLAGRLFNLSDILIEPRFLAPEMPASPHDEDDIKSVFHFVPVVPDHPYLLAPYHVESFSIDDLATGGRTLALLGRPGSGRTTALLAIVLRALGQFEFRSAPDKVQQRLDAEEAALDDKKRAVRIKDRIVLEQRAKEQLAKEQGTAFDAEGQIAGSLFNRMMPVYIHLADINPRDSGFGAEIDPAEPVVRTVQRQLGRIAASTMPESLYKRLSRGQVLFLIDGYDDLPESERSRQTAWLEALMTTYHENFFIVTGPAVGYGALTGRLGLTPLFLRPWSDRDVAQAADNWADAWAKIGGKRRLKAARPEAAVIERVKNNNRALSPLDVTLKIWAGYANDAEASGTEGLIRAFLARQLPSDQALGILLPQLTKAAVLQLEAGFITEAQLIARITGQHAAVEAVPDDASDDKKGKAGKKDAKEESAQGKLLSMLDHSGLLTRSYGGRYQFRHSFLAAYLASLSFKDAPAEQLASKALNPSWSAAIGYAALHTPIDEAVRIRLNAPADVLYKGVLEIANWMSYSSADAAWRNPFMKYVANLFLAPNQYPLIGERTAAVIAATHDKNAMAIFRQGLKNTNPRLRRLAALGIGAIGEEEGVADLVSRLKDDEDEDVQIASAIGLMAIHTDDALTTVVEAFTEGSERLRQAIAETFADMPEEGYAVLFDAIQDQEMMLRRAAVLGLKRVKSTWALIAIYRAFLEDQQWYVRSAAQIAFQELQHGKEHGPRAYIPVEAMPWLTQWASRRGENVPPGESANMMLLKALQEGDADIRVFAAAQLGQMGIASTTRSLYAALRDKKSEVREAAHRSLAELELQIGKPLPAPF